MMLDKGSIMSQINLQSNYDITILGAGPVGLTIANYLGMQGIKTLVIEQLDSLIDYPRAIGIDDESLRTLQSLGVIEQVLPHITPEHAMRFLTPKGRCFADIQPKTYEFGFSRRNAFIQPQVDKVLLDGLSRFEHVDIMFSSTLEKFEQDSQGVTLQLKKVSGESLGSVRSQYFVACDGGNSSVRRGLNISFEGQTAPNKWIVVDIADDPLATPHIYLCADPVRPYVSAALPHGIRRFEFMVMPNETEEELSKPENMAKLLAKVLPNPQDAKLIRQRVYTHNARVAGEFKRGRILLAGDAAHIMPVWQGQGYNSGMRDAFNLAWKLAYVIKGYASDALLDSYQMERKAHAQAMVDLSVTAGHVLAPPKKWQGMLRDGISYVLNYIPPVKNYFLEMRFKPMPKYEQGVVVHQDDVKNSPAGKMFIQPNIIDQKDGKSKRLDDVIGNRFAVLCWETDPRSKMSEITLAKWRALGACFVQVVAPHRLSVLAPSQDDDFMIIGDESLAIRNWLGQGHHLATVFLRPDRFVAAVSVAQHTEQTSQMVFAKLYTK